MHHAAPRGKRFRRAAPHGAYVFSLPQRGYRGSAPFTGLAPPTRSGGGSRPGLLALVGQVESSPPPPLRPPSAGGGEEGRVNAHRTRAKGPGLNPPARGRQAFGGRSPVNGANVYTLQARTHAHTRPVGPRWVQLRGKQAMCGSPGASSRGFARSRRSGPSGPCSGATGRAPRGSARCPWRRRRRLPCA